MTQKLLSIFLISLSISNPALGQDAVEINKGTPAPFTGILLTLEHSASIAKELRTKEMTEQLNKSLEHSLSITQKNYAIEMEKTTILNSRNDKLAESLQSAQHTSDLEKIVYVGMGIALSVFGAFIVKSVK